MYGSLVKIMDKYWYSLDTFTSIRRKRDGVSPGRAS